MTKQEVVRMAFRGEKPPYTPWSFSFTLEALEKLKNHYGKEDLSDLFRNHFLGLGSGNGFFTPLTDGCVRDIFGVVWDRSVDKDIGIIRGQVLPEPSLKGYLFPDPVSSRVFGSMRERVEQGKGLFKVFSIGFSLYERAWTLRGMENLMMDFYDHPDFVHGLLDAIADYNIAQVREALKYDIDAVHFGDDWGQQHGLQMGIGMWREFIKPRLRRMYCAVKEAGKFVSIHSCGDVDELFDDLIDIGLDCFNPFQPEVMDVEALHSKYLGRLCFHGGLSTQKTLPYGTPADVVRETEKLIRMGRRGGYIFAPAHAVEGDVPVENMVAFIETVNRQTNHCPIC